MLDIRRIRTEPDAVRAALARRSDPSLVVALDALIDLDNRHRSALTEHEATRARIKELSKGGKPDDAAIEEGRKLRDRDKQLAGEVDELAAAVRDAILRIPNTPSADAPDGAGAPVCREDGDDRMGR